MDYLVGGYLAVLSAEDIRHRKIPLWILMISMLAGLIYGFWRNGVTATFINIIPGIILSLLAVILPGCVGLADGGLAVWYGFIYGWQNTCIWLMLGFWSAAVWGILRSLCRKERGVQIPFIPFMMIAHVGICI